MYKIFIKPFLFLMSPEKAHYFVTGWLTFLAKIPGISALLAACYTTNDKRLERKLFGLTFKNPVGLAAGFDKDARWYNELANFGFGFIEIGTLTPKPQSGNPKPRIFRILADKGIINRMGFNNLSAAEAIRRLKKRKTDSMISSNIGKNTNTANEEALSDYVFDFNTLHDYVDYFVVNVSCPNIGDIQKLQDIDFLLELLNTLKAINAERSKPKPILLKIAP